MQIDISFIDEITKVTKTLGGGLSFIFLAWYNYKKIIWLIRGTSPVEGHGQFGAQLRGE